jgi:hypothetical protein
MLVYPFAPSTPPLLAFYETWDPRIAKVGLWETYELVLITAAILTGETEKGTIVLEGFPEVGRPGDSSFAESRSPNVRGTYLEVRPVVNLTNPPVPGVANSVHRIVLKIEWPLLPTEPQR